jgi:hypothetical protein
MNQFILMEDKVCIVYEYMDLDLGQFIRQSADGVAPEYTRVSCQYGASFLSFFVASPTELSEMCLS